MLRVAPTRARAGGRRRVLSVGDREEISRGIAQGADGVVVGSALIDAMRATLDAGGQATPQTVEAVAALVRGLAEGVRSVRKAEAA